MESEILLVILGGLLSAVTGYIGPMFPKINNLFVLAALALIVGVAGYALYFLIGGTSYFEDIITISTGGFAWGAALYQIFKNVTKTDEDLKKL